MNLAERNSMTLEQRKENAKPAEEAFIRWHKENGKRRLEDVREVSRYKFDDIDFILHSENEKPIMVDVKSRSAREEPIELRYELAYENKLGWGVRTISDYLFYVWLDESDNKKPKKAWIVDTLKWKQYLTWPRKYKKVIYIPADGMFDIYTKIEELIREKIIIKTITLT